MCKNAGLADFICLLLFTCLSSFSYAETIERYDRNGRLVGRIQIEDGQARAYDREGKFIQRSVIDKDSIDKYNREEKYNGRYKFR